MNDPLKIALKHAFDERDAEIKRLTEQRDRAMKVVEAARRFRERIDKTGWPHSATHFSEVRAALDAEAAAETAPSLPETP